MRLDALLVGVLVGAAAYFAAYGTGFADCMTLLTTERIVGSRELGTIVVPAFPLHEALGICVSGIADEPPRLATAAIALGLLLYAAFVALRIRRRSAAA